MSGRNYLIERLLRSLNPGEYAQPQEPARLQVIAVLKSDPVGVIEREEDERPDGVARPTEWMQRLRGRARSDVGVRPLSGQVTFSGRACCADWLSRYDGRQDQRLPFDTTCPTCQATYTITLKFVRSA